MLARELTKIHEEFIRGNISTILEQFVDIKGEFVIIIEGNNISKKENDILELNNKTLEEHYLFYKEKGLEKKDIIKKIAKDRNIEKAMQRQRRIQRKDGKRYPSVSTSIEATHWPASRSEPHKKYVVSYPPQAEPDDMYASSAGRQ